MALRLGSSVRAALQHGRLAGYATGEDTIQLPSDKPLPKTLIRRIATFRVKAVTKMDSRWMY